MEPGGSAHGAPAAAPPVHVTVCNPLSKPYRTGSYLIYDIPTGSPCHFRDAMDLQPNPYPASGSHQLNAGQLTQVLKNLVSLHKPRDLFLVDLRQETHGFIGGSAASWYADNDFGNVGLSTSLIERDEQARLSALDDETTQIYTKSDDSSDNRGQGRVMPVSYEEITVTTPTTERMAFDNLKIGKCTVHYSRIPVTDHCAPSDAAMMEFRKLAVSTDPESSWLHFHCHGGDGRTTTFLALYDMVCWKRSAKDPFPALEVFACRQYGLNPNYCVNPDGCDCGTETSPPTAGWKRPLALQRWEVLKDFHDALSDGAAV